MKLVSHSLHYVGVAFSALFGLLLLMLLGVVIWLSTAPREVPFTKEIIKQRLVRQVLVQDADMASLKAYLNLSKLEMEAQIDAFEMELPGGDVEIEKIRLSSPLKYLARRKVGFDVLLFDDVHINVRNHPDIIIPSFYIEPEEGDIKQTHLALDLSQVAEGAQIEGKLEIHDTHISLNMENEHIPLSLLALLGKDFMGVSGLTTGEFYVSFGKDGVVRYAKTSQEIIDISYENSELYPKDPLTFGFASFTADWKHKNSEVTVSEFLVVRDDAAISGNVFHSDATSEAEIDIKNLPVDTLKILAPNTAQAKESRKWVRKHLFDGMIETGKVIITDDETDPFEAILNISGVRAEPSPKIPPMLNVSGVATVKQDALNVDIHHATTLKATTLKAGKISVKSFAEGAAPMDITLEVVSNAKDVATFLLPKYLNKAQKLNLKPKLVQGDVQGQAFLTFPLYPARAGLGNSSFNNVDIDLEAQLQNVSHPSLLGDLPIQDMSGTLKLNNDRVTVNAKGLLKNTPTEIEATHIYGDGKADTEYEATLQIADGELHKFDVPIPDKYVRGITKLHAKVSENEARQDVDATLDFEQAALDIDLLNWQKPKGKPATLKVHQYKAGGVNKIKSMEFNAESAQAKGSLVLDDDGALQSASLTELKFHDNNMALEYEEAAFPIINVTASQFYVPEFGEKSDEQPFDFLLGKRINADIDTLYYKKVPFSNVSLNSTCNKALCSSLSMNMKQKDNAIKASIAQDEKGRALRVSIDDAGALLSALDIMDYMQGGKVNFTGYYQDENPKRPIKGNVVLDNMKVVGAPFLTKIFTLASLRGLSDTLSGNGIAFDKTTADIMYDKGNIIIEKLAAKGDAVGVMVEGSMSVNEPEMIDIDGTLIPSYALNSLPGKVPIIGEMLVGGEGEGMFGTRFSAKGALGDPNISANPLSMLTPGFLRNIFNIFPDADAPETLKEEKPYGGRHQP